MLLEHFTVVVIPTTKPSCQPVTSEALILLMQQQGCETYIYFDLHFAISSLRNGQNNILSCKRRHLCKWHCWVSKLKHFNLHTIRSNCAKYQVSSFNTLWDMVKTNFCHVGGTTCGDGASWCPDYKVLLPMPQGVTVSNIKSLALLGSEIWPKQIFIM